MGVFEKGYKRPKAHPENQEKWLEEWAALREDQGYRWGEPREDGTNPSRFNQ